MKRRIWALLLALVLTLALAACGGTGDTPSRSPEGLVSLPVATQPAAPETGTPVPESEAPATETPTPESEVPTTETPAPESEVPTTETPAPESDAPAEETDVQETDTPVPALDEDGFYHTKDEVALYIHLYGRLPDNYITKREAQELGWSGGSVERYAGEGTAIGGSRFGNYEGLLPEKEGRTYKECDIDTVGASSRGAKRIIFSNDGLVYYTGDHYASFELLYGEP